jgi:ribosomal protein S18 acetylase RimI-like enzyme
MTKQHNIRLATQTDAVKVNNISRETGLSDAAGDDFKLEPMNDQHIWIVLEDEAGKIVGAAYFGPESHSDRVWNLYFLGVSRDAQGGGIGSALVAWVEANLRTRGQEVAKLLLIETSSLESFEPTRAFYRKQGYVQEARIRDYYGSGDDKIVFWKSLTSPEQLV